MIDDQGRDLYDEENSERAAGTVLPEEDYEFVDDPESQYILESVESDGRKWPFSRRNGSCSNCAAVLISGDIEVDWDQAPSDNGYKRKTDA